MEIAAVLVALLGHAFLWIGLVNRLHAADARRAIINAFTLAFFLCAALIPVGIGGWWYAKSIICPATASCCFAADGSYVGIFIAAYLVVCWIVAPATLLRLVYLRRFLLRMPPVVRFHGRRPAEINPASAADENAHHFLARLPMNEILRLEVSQWTLDVPRLAPALSGLSIVHLSDFHLTGRVGKAYFREVVRVSNELRPDLVALTGDIIDNPKCLGWIADTLGQLTARHGVYFILGNHDRRTGDIGQVSRTLEHNGLVYLGGRQRQIEIDGHPVLLAGNERPWIGQWGGHSCLPSDRQECLSSGADSDALRIALAHCPDQLRWARAWGADLMLAGHTHGGQIRIPPLGAIFVPTYRGVKYVSGVFYSPPTILHVSRGVSGDIPIRWLCPPEIACLQLYSSRSA